MILVGSRNSEHLETMGYYGRLWVAKSHRPAFSTSSAPIFAALIARLRPHLWASRLTRKRLVNHLRKLLIPLANGISPAGAMPPPMGFARTAFSPDWAEAWTRK